MVARMGRKRRPHTRSDLFRPALTMRKFASAASSSSGARKRTGLRPRSPGGLTRRRPVDRGRNRGTGLHAGRLTFTTCTPPASIRQGSTLRTCGLAPRSAISGSRTPGEKWQWRGPGSLRRNEPRTGRRASWVVAFERGRRVSGEGGVKASADPEVARAPPPLGDPAKQTALATDGSVTSAGLLRGGSVPWPPTHPGQPAGHAAAADPDADRRPRDDPAPDETARGRRCPDHRGRAVRPGGFHGE